MTVGEPGLAEPIWDQLQTEGWGLKFSGCVVVKEKASATMASKATAMDK